MTEPKARNDDLLTWPKFLVMWIVLGATVLVGIVALTIFEIAELKARCGK